MINSIHSKLSKELSELKISVNNVLDNTKSDINHKEKTNNLQTQNMINFSHGKLSKEMSELKLALGAILNKTHNDIANKDLKHMDQVKDIITTISDKMSREIGDLKTSVNTILGKAQHNAVHKGQIAENNIKNILKNYYPNAYIEQSSNISKSADIKFALNDLKILIESKHYSTLVGNKEIEKFKRDLRQSSERIGILYSFESNISGVNNSFKIEHYNNRIIFYVVASLSHPSSIIVPIEFAKYIYKLNEETNIDLEMLEDKSYEILKSLKMLDSLYEICLRNFESVKEEKIILVNSIDKILYNSLETKNRLSNIINEIKNNINKIMYNNDIKSNNDDYVKKINTEGYNENSRVILDYMSCVLKKFHTVLYHRKLKNIFVKIDGMILIKYTVYKSNITCNFIDNNSVTKFNKKNLDKFEQFINMYIPKPMQSRSIQNVVE